MMKIQGSLPTPKQMTWIKLNVKQFLQRNRRDPLVEAENVFPFVYLLEFVSKSFGSGDAIFLQS